MYYEPAKPKQEEIEYEELIKSRIDYWHTKMCYLGVRWLKKKLEKEDKLIVGRKLIKRYMDEMGIYAVYPKPNLSRRDKQNKIYPYLLRNISIDKPNQVWAIDITYIKMGKSHMYLTAIIDWYSRVSRQAKPADFRQKPYTFFALIIGYGLAVFETETVACHVYDFAMMDEAVKDSSSNCCITQKVSPFIKTLV